MPYVPPSTAYTQPTPIPLPKSNTDQATKPDGSSSLPAAAPHSTLAPPTIGRTSRTASLSALPPRTPSPPMANASVGLLAKNFAGVGLSDNSVPTLQNRYESTPIDLQSSNEDGNGDMALAPPDLPSGGPLSVEIDTTGNASDVHSGPSRRPSEPASLPALSEAGFDGNNSSSSTSIDTLADASPVDPDVKSAQHVMIVGSADEQDPKVLALNRYKEGIYLYTRGLWIEAKNSSTRSDKRRASASSGSGSGSFGGKQSGMERLAAKKALARRLNA